ncbi:unnamed protein product [Moritella viscosa]|uniref:Uncharacterized protein n=1 Tax=Moritella viscosa TaxID=80854 RepID=A0ABY1HIZ6_9GAMM|nr:unnamed protein product [Moritella viscosa]
MSSVLKPACFLPKAFIFVFVVGVMLFGGIAFVFFIVNFSFFGCKNYNL